MKYHTVCAELIDLKGKRVVGFEEKQKDLRTLFTNWKNRSIDIGVEAEVKLSNKFMAYLECQVFHNSRTVYYQIILPNEDIVKKLIEEEAIVMFCEGELIYGFKLPIARALQTMLDMTKTMEFTIGGENNG